ncbi:MAG TPA: NUDIX domain-containing protein [Limnochordales bacterium]
MTDGAGSRLPGERDDERPAWAAVDRFLAAEGVGMRCRDLFMDPDRQRLSALCYVEHQGRVLMLRRHKEPFAGHWTAPGGKLLPGEDPREAVLREVREEAGLILERPELRLACSETGEGAAYNWVVFVFRARPVVAGAPPELLAGPRTTDEGQLDWLPREELASYAIPDVDRQLLPYILAPAGDPPYYVRIHYGPDHRVAAMRVQPLARGAKG